jgi:hypothetical protein
VFLVVPPLQQLIKVDTFSKLVSSCVNTCRQPLDHTFVDLDRVAEQCKTIVYNELPSVTSDKYRVPPTVLMRFARGGKTTTISRVFDQLKDGSRAVHPILISFNGNGKGAFQRRNGETQEQAILRLIAVQLCDYSPEESQRIVVDREALDKHLGDDNVVLLIDELNILSAGMPLDSDAAKLLREMFLDRAGRYLVFTSHVPVSIEAYEYRADNFLGTVAHSPPSLRGVLTVDMSLARTLEELRGMSMECGALTEERAAWLGYIPSLIYVVMNDTGKFHVVTPSMRFIQMNIVVEPGHKPNVLQRFVDELLSGQRDPVVARYYGAFASVGADYRVSYPLCYVKEIFTQLRICPAVAVLLDVLNKLEASLSAKHSGLVWECTVQAAIILRMLEAELLGSVGPFGLVPVGTKPDLAFHTLPDECDTLENARARIDNLVRAYSSPTLVYVASANARFPEVEGFVVYTSGSFDSAKIVGFQMKTADVKPRNDMNTSIINGGGVLIRGHALAKNPRESKLGWEYITSKQVRAFLGNSLLLAVPRDLLQDP